MKWLHLPFVQCIHHDYSTVHPFQSAFVNYCMHSGSIVYVYRNILLSQVFKCQIKKRSDDNVQLNILGSIVLNLFIRGSYRILITSLGLLLFKY